MRKAQPSRLPPWPGQDARSRSRAAGDTKVSPEAGAGQAHAQGRKAWDRRLADPAGSGLGHGLGSLEGTSVMAREGSTEQMGVGVGLRDRRERKVSLAGGGRGPLGGVGVMVVK